MRLGVARGAHCGLDDALWGCKIWLTRSETDYIFALGLQGLGLSVNCECR
jgi:hypothetical protein